MKLGDSYSLLMFLQEESHREAKISDSGESVTRERENGGGRSAAEVRADGSPPPGGGGASEGPGHCSTCSRKVGRVRGHRSRQVTDLVEGG